MLAGAQVNGHDTVVHRSPQRTTIEEATITWVIDRPQSIFGDRSISLVNGVELLQ
jgi:hypothetical protein